MKISRIETFLLRSPPPSDWKFPTASFVSGGSIFLKISTDEGIFGWGEPSPYGAATEATLQALNGGISELLLGKSPADVNELTHQEETRGEHLYGKAAWTSAIAGVSQALWDIIGKAAGKPVYQLLNPAGSWKKEVRAYASGGMIFDDSPRAWLLEEALKAQEEGYTAWKFRPTTPLGAASHFQRNLNPPAVNLPDLLSTSRNLRKALGDKFGLMLDLGCRISSFDEALRLGKEISDLSFEFLEEPMPRDPALYADLAKRIAVPVAAGECFFSAAKFQQWLELGALDTLQPDGNFAGITEILGIASLARTAGKPMVLHNWSSAVSIAANLHLAAALPEVTMLEFNLTYNPLRTELVHEPYVPTRGSFVVNDKPGLGIEIDPTALKTYAG